MEEKNYEDQVRALVDTFFEDTGTTERWMRARNPLLGGVSPIDMLQAGRGEKLFKFVENQLSHNPPKEEEKVNA